MNDIAKKTMRFSFFSAATIALVSIARGHPGWAAGILVATFWSVINFSMITGLLEIALLKNSPSRISAILFVKFPVLYLAGYFILTSKLFPVMSILAGVTLTLIAIGMVNIWPKHT